ncbi:MAG: flagellar assembly protein FliW [Candidatus Krumholzibacteria bacterium]|nr:flagellar assembly protein FliW [Candidatus Krumholzibacteria bacterium]
MGMPDLRNWLVLEMGDDLPMKWFQSLDRGDFGFPVSQPAFFADTYDISIPASSESLLKGRQGEWLAILIITTVHAGGTRITGNLLAPLVINVDTRLGVQMVQDNPDWGVQQEMNYLKFGLAVDGQPMENEPVIDEGRDLVEAFTQEVLDSPSESDQSEVRPEVETPEPAGV